MREEDKLRNTLREYYDNQEAPFSDNEWERASAYLSTARRGRRIRYAAFILIALFSALFIALLNFPASFSNKKHPASSLSDQRLKYAPTRQSAVLRAPILSPSTIKAWGNSNSDKGFRQSANTLISVPITRRNTSEMHAGLPAARTSQVFEPNIPAAAGSDPVKGKNANEGNAIDTSSVSTPVTIANMTASDNNIPDGIIPEAAGDPKENAEMVPVRVEDPAHNQNQVMAKEIPQVPVNVLPQGADTVTLNENKKEIVATDTAKFTIPREAVPAALADTSRQASIANTTPTTEIAVGDTLPEPLSPNSLAGEGIFYEAGGAWLYGWKGPVHRDARGFSPVVGVNYMNRLSNRCSFSFGLQYLQVNNLSNSSKTSRMSSYTYGEQSSVTVITPSTVHYLLAPLRFHYYVNHRNSFGAGINLAYLLNVDATVTSYDERPGFTGNYKTVKLGGYTEGFSWFDSQLAFCYRRKIGRSFGLQAEIFIGLTDVKQDEFFAFRNKERNSGAKLSLVYYAFRKNGR